MLNLCIVISAQVKELEEAQKIVDKIYNLVLDIVPADINASISQEIKPEMLN